MTNIFAPQGLLLAALAMGRVSYVTWVKWVWPIILVQWVLAGIFVTVAHGFFWTCGGGAFYPAARKSSRTVRTALSTLRSTRQMLCQVPRASSPPSTGTLA